MHSYNYILYIYIYFFFYCVLGFAVQVKNMQDCCVGTYMAMWFAASISLSPISGISPHVFPPQAPHHLLPLPYSPNRPQCVVLPSLYPCVLMFNTHLWVRTCSVWFSVLVSVCWECWFPGSSMSLQRTWTHCFLWLHSIPWCICATFFQSSLLSMGIWVDSRSLLL